MKQQFYKGELEKFRLEDGTNASDKFDDKFVEFMEYKEDMNTMLEYDGEHPAPVKSLPIFNEAEEFYKDKKIANWKTNFVYAADHLPTIALFMMGPWQRTNPFFNVIDV